MRSCLLFFVVTILIGSISCTKNENPESSSGSASEDATASQKVPKIVAFGNSLTAGLGLTAAETYPARLQAMLDQAGYKYEVVNAGVSGDTTSAGLRRIDWVIDENVEFVILELGANDILRGIPIDLMKQNLGQIIENIQHRGVVVILAGMEAPTNSGPEYRKEVHEAYRELAEEHRTPFIPFVLKGIAGEENLNQEDLSHPNPEGARVLAQNVFEVLQPLLKH